MIQVRRLGSQIGAEITGVDVRTLDDAAFDIIYRAWLYARGGNDPILHVIANKPKEQLVKGVIDHMAFTGLDLAGTVANLKARSIEYDLRQLPEYGTWQLFFDDPNGAKIELDFDKDERAPA